METGVWVPEGPGGEHQEGRATCLSRAGRGDPTAKLEVGQGESSLPGGTGARGVVL